MARWCVPPEWAGLVPVPAVSELPCWPARLLGPACGGDRLVLLLLLLLVVLHVTGGRRERVLPHGISEWS